MSFNSGTLVLLCYLLYCRGQTGNEPQLDAFAHPEMFSSSQPYTGQIFQPARSSEFPSDTTYPDSFDEEPPLLEGTELKHLITLFFLHVPAAMHKAEFVHIHHIFLWHLESDLFCPYIKCNV